MTKVIDIKQFQPSEHIDTIMKEMQEKYSLSSSDISTIVNSSISSVYKTELPVLIVENGVYLVFINEDNELKYSKIKYSKQKLKSIISKIDEMANIFYIKAQRDKVINFINNKKPYMHAEFIYSDDKKDYYNLFFDAEHEQVANGVKACTNICSNKKDRIFIDFTSASINKNVVYFMDHKKYISKKNLIVFVKDINTEIFKKIDKRIWIDVKNINMLEKIAYLHLPLKTTKPIIEYIRKRIKEVFELNVVFIKDK